MTDPTFRARAASLLIRAGGRFARREDGVATAFGLFMFLLALGLGGLAVDMAAGVRAQSQLQVAGDAAAHAALVRRDWGTLAEARAAAVEYARRNLPPSTFGEVLRESDVHFGRWDRQTETFTVDNTEWETVAINTEAFQAHGNPVQTLFLRFFGRESWDVRRGSVFESVRPRCFTEGFVADDVVDVTSNNTFEDNFCIHSNTQVSMNNHNSFGTGVYVSVPEGKQVVHGGYGANPGLEDAIRKQEWNLRVEERLDQIIAGLYALDPRYLPSYVNTSIVSLGLPVSGNKFTALDFVPGTIYEKVCNGGKKLSFASGIILTNVVLLTNCEISFGGDVVLEDVVIATTSTKSVHAAQGLTLGRDDDCAPGGGTQILTYGDFSIAAGLRLFGGQIIAMGDVHVAADADGIGGASVVSASSIDMTTHINVGYCGQGMEGNFDIVREIRLAG